MTDPSGNPEDVRRSPGVKDAGGTDRDDTVGAPRWVKVFGLVALALAVLVVVVLLVGGGPGGHGPGRHGPGHGMSVTGWPASPS